MSDLANAILEYMQSTKKMEFGIDVDLLNFLDTYGKANVYDALAELEDAGLIKLNSRYIHDIVTLLT